MKTGIKGSWTTTQKEIIQAFGFNSPQQILTNYPLRYEEYVDHPLESWKIGESFRFEAKTIGRSRSFGFGKKAIVHFDVIKEDQIIEVTIFNRPWAKNLPENHVITLYGKYKGQHKFTASNYDLKAMKEHASLEPIYSMKAEFQQRSIRAFIKKAVLTFVPEVVDTLPLSLQKKYNLVSLKQALWMIHVPESKEALRQATRRLKYEEFLRFFSHLYLRNQEVEYGTKTVKKVNSSYLHELVEQLPFELTPDQQNCLKEILEDLKSSKKMNRLVQGDVGSGKTILAALSLLAVQRAGYQAALLAPTEILAQQHFQTLKTLFKSETKQLAFLSSGLSLKEKKEILEGIQFGSITMVVGTHALLQDQVQFKNLGLLVVDEQQRFGVEQRERLKLQSEEVDVLVMTATPIPRTLASSLLGGMDLSTIHTMPQGRKAPITKRIEENSFRSVLPEVMALLEQGHQLYVICASVQANEDFGRVRNVQDTRKNLAKLFPQYSVASIHGQLKSSEKEAIMQDFYANKIQILVSTTVVEVGMNCVNATGMIIYDADRFGLSTLHQLRGRVQRGLDQGYCWLLSSSQEELSKQRLEVLVQSYDGFYISEQDLRLRGPGDILGLRQSGLPSFILGNLIEDEAFVEQAKQDAKEILDHLEISENTRFKDSLLEERKRYGN